MGSYTNCDYNLLKNDVVVLKQARKKLVKESLGSENPFLLRLTSRRLLCTNEGESLEGGIMDPYQLFYPFWIHRA
jgi:hypothetical protein